MAHDPANDIGLVKDGVVVQVARAPTNAAAFGPSPDGDLVDFAPGVASPEMLWDGARLSAPPAPVVSTVPQSVSMRQARLALLNAGLLPQVTAAIAAASPDVEIWYDTSPVIERQNTVLLGLATTLNLSSDQVDALFVAAAALP